jgi:hypothetical protein
VLSGLGEAAQQATYQVMTPGTYDIYFTASGAPTQVFYHTGSFLLSANQPNSFLPERLSDNRE